MKKYVSMFLVSIYSAQALASGCDWYWEGKPLIQRTELVFAESQRSDYVTDWFHFLCLVGDTTQNCAPVMQPRYSDDLNLFVAIDDNYWTTWNSKTLAPEQYKKMRKEFMTGHFTATQYKENLFGYFDNNCTGEDFPPLATGRIRYEYKFTDPEIGTWNFADIGFITPKNMKPLIQKD